VAPEAAARLAHHDLKGETRWGDVLELMANAKVVLNSRITFSRGAHERMFYALSRGAVVATEPSAFLADELENRLGMVLLPADAGDMDRTLEGLLADDAALDEIRRRGLESYVGRHTWKERAARILEGLSRHREAGRGMA
jgi:glycosyltransferase involved in cell wall biosynthesis